MDEPLLVGCDIGTSSVKTVLVSSAGAVLARAKLDYAMRHPRPGWSEVDPSAWWEAAAETIHAVVSAADDRRRIAGVAVVAQREPVVLLSGGRPLCPALSWTDRRARDELTTVIEEIGWCRFVETTGMAPNVGMTLAHLLWLRRNKPTEWQAADEILFAKDYVLRQLCGSVATDHTTPSRSGLFDITTLAWSPVILEAFDLAKSRLPDIDGAPWQIAARLQHSAAAVLGLPSGVPVAFGGSDDAAAALGAGAVEPGEMCIGTGTATDIRLISDQPAVDLDGRADVSPHVVAGRFLRETAIESTGSSLRFFLDLLTPAGKGSADHHSELLAEAAVIEPGSAGLQVLPFVDGAARAPWFLPHAQGGVLGIVSGHGPAHLVRGALEAVAFEYRSALSGIGPLSEPVTIGDGEARVRSWNQIKADVTNIRLRVPVIVELAAAGAAILAGTAVGVFGDARQGAEAIVRTAEVIEPDPGRHHAYQGLAHAYEQTLEALRSTFGSPRTP